MFSGDALRGLYELEKLKKVGIAILLIWSMLVWGFIIFKSITSPGEE